MEIANAKRFVVEDSFTRVTSDGEPHGMMTAIAALSGLLAAMVILAVLGSLVGCKKSRRVNLGKAGSNPSTNSNENINKMQYSLTQEDDDSRSSSSNRSSVLSILRRGSSKIENELTLEDTNARPRLVSVSCISNGNFEGNLNSAFVGSELNLCGSLRKKKGTNKLSNAQDASCHEMIKAKETIIDMERY